MNGTQRAGFVTGAITATTGFALNAMSMGFHIVSNQLYNNSYGPITVINGSCVLTAFLNAMPAGVPVADFLQYTGTTAVGVGGLLMLVSACRARANVWQVY